MESYRDSNQDPAPVLILGASGVDFVGRTKNDLEKGTSTPAHIRASWGGVARNVAENLILLGQPVTLLTAVGDDELGDQLIRHVREAGVDTERVLRLSQRPTGAYLAVLERAGELLFALDDMRAVEALTPSYLQEHRDAFEGSSALFLDANVPAETMRSAFHLAREAGLPIYADPTSNSLAPRLQPYLPELSGVTPNAAEATALSEIPFDASDPDQAIQVARQLVGQGVDMAIITLAEFGVCYATEETSGSIPAIRTEIVDPTGAGDALTATVIFALLNGIPEDDAIRLGASAASLTLRQSGTVHPDLSLELLYDQLII